jgi:putrescine aminotransferase
MASEIVYLEDALAASREEVVDWYARYVNPGIARLLSLLGVDRRFVHARGACVVDEQGIEYIDLMGGFGSLNLGHNHPEVMDALNEIGDLPNILHISMGATTAALARTLAAIAPGALERTFFCNSGAEAVESALKLARISTGRTKILHCRDAYHGKTLGALSVTGHRRYQAPFEPLVPGCHAVPYGDCAALERELSQGEYAAFIVEPIQGEHGIIVPPAGYLKRAERLCQDFGTLLIVDEVQTGLGRTGTMFAVEHEGVVPDIMALAKSLGGGVMPLGACIATETVWERGYGSLETCTLHTSTLGGNARACAAGLKTIEIILRDALPDAAAERGEDFLSRLRALADKHGMVKEVRGRGLMIGVEFAEPRAVGGPAGRYLGALVAHELFHEHHMITAYSVSNPNVLRLEPPLTISTDQIDRFCDALDTVFQKGVLGLAARVALDFVESKLGITA